MIWAFISGGVCTVVVSTVAALGVMRVARGRRHVELLESWVPPKPRQGGRS